MAIVVSRSGSIRGTVITDADVYVVDDKVMLTGYYLNNFMALPNNTFLVQASATAGGPDAGANYWIFDANLDVVSGPTAAFTGLAGFNYENAKGGAV